MTAPKGNKFWMARASHGPNKKFKTAEELWNAACEYFEWVEANPLWEQKVTQYQGIPVSMEVEKMRPMTLAGLCIFFDMARNTWQYWKTDEVLGDTVAKIEDIIRTQKFEGAAADLFNANIIAREIGLTEKSSQEITGANGGPIQTESKVEWVVQPVKPISND